MACFPFPTQQFDLWVGRLEKYSIFSSIIRIANKRDHSFLTNVDVHNTNEKKNISKIYFCIKWGNKIFWVAAIFVGRSERGKLTNKILFLAWRKYLSPHWICKSIHMVSFRFGVGYWWRTWSYKDVCTLISAFCKFHGRYDLWVPSCYM
jgi:hypothetical protein